MSTQVTITLSDEGLYEAQELAEIINREEILNQAMALILPVESSS
jgi:predicted transcriptional regulator